MKSSTVTGAACVLLLLASAASCAVSKEYANRVFNSKPEKKPDSTLAIKFMEFDSDVASDSIDLAKVFISPNTDSNMLNSDSVKTDVAAEPLPRKPVPTNVENKKPAKGMSSGTVRSKRTRQ